MAMRELKYPIGIQTFETIRNDGYVYVDKTAYIYDIISKGQYYFLSRPRRFGKSLLISTIEAVFKGKRELFKGLAIDSSDWNWEKHEVLHFDLNPRNYKEHDSLRTILDVHLRNWETHYGISPDSDILVDRFAAIIRKAYHLSGNKVVILVDEYDKPLVATITDRKLQDEHRNLLQSFYGVLKTLDPFIRFGMLTGISKFSKVSIFSGLNNLEDISLQPQYNAICGITEKELYAYFEGSMEEMARSENVGVDEIHNQLKANYDGYHFANTDEDVYNPFSLLNTFKSKMFGSYWLATGTTSSLLEVLNVNSYRIQDLEGCRATATMLNGADIFLTDPIPFFFQTGYLTIKGYDREFKEYILGFPNREVSEGFNDLVLKTWMRRSEPTAIVSDFVRDVRSGKAEEFMCKLQTFFAGIPYDHAAGSRPADDEYGIRGDKEVHYQNVMFVIMKLMGFYTHTEYRTSNGRIDMLVETADYVYVMEFKIDSTAEAAMRQINGKGYALPFGYSHKKIIKIGASFDTRTRRLADWIIEPEF